MNLLEKQILTNRTLDMVEVGYIDSYLINYIIFSQENTMKIQSEYFFAEICTYDLLVYAKNDFWQMRGIC